MRRTSFDIAMSFASRRCGIEIEVNQLFDGIRREAHKQVKNCGFTGAAALGDLLCRKSGFESPLGA
jgi:hypothetical protein